MYLSVQIPHDNLSALALNPAEECPKIPPPVRGKGKSKIVITDDDIPLALMKKSRHGYHDSTGFLSSLEMAALSLTELQFSTPNRGPVQSFMASPLYGNHGQIWETLPQPTMDFAPESGGHSDRYVESSDTAISDVNATFIAPVVDSPVISRRFYRASRGRRRLFNDTGDGAEMDAQPSPSLTSSDQAGLELLEAGPVRPPPPA